MIATRLSILFAFLVSSCGLFGQTWVQKASLPGTAFTRHHPVTFSIDGYGYLLGGSSAISPYLSDFYRYDPLGDEWTKLPDFPGPVRSYSYAIVHEGKAYMGFGFGPLSDMTDMWVYDPVTSSWTEKSLCPGEGRGHPAFLETNGKIYVGTGGSAIGNLNDFWEYDIATDQWEQLPDFPSHKRHHPFYFTIGDMVYIGLGHGSQSVDGTTIYNDLYRFDPPTETWDRMNDFPGEQRVAGTQFSLNGKGYVLSGEGKDHYYLEEGEFWEYEPSDDSWTQLPSMPGSGRWAPGSFVIGNTVYAGCGTALVGNSNAENQRDLWAYTFNNVSSTNQNGDEALAIQVYPNPVKDRVFVQGEWPAETRFQIINAGGQVLRQGVLGNNAGMDVSMLPIGVFELMLVHENRLKVGRFVRI